MGFRVRRGSGGGGLEEDERGERDKEKNRWVRKNTGKRAFFPHGTNVKRMNANRAIRITAQRTQGLCCVSGGDMTANKR